MRKRLPEFNSWVSMRQRCYNPNNKAYDRYGGRGIAVCRQWQGPGGFKQFLADMGPRPSPTHSVDRKDNDLDYTPDNCRWATKQEQADNRRWARMLTYKDETRRLRDWAMIKGIPWNVVRQRLDTYNWTIEEALETPIGTRIKTGERNGCTKLFFERDGRRQALKDWAHELDLPYIELYRALFRKRLGFEEAINFVIAKR